MENQVTAHEVAKLAGVSQSSVSRVFTKGASVSGKTREKVLKAAEQLGYRPNEYARSLIMRKSSLIGLVMKGVSNPYYPHAVKKFTSELKKLGYSVLLIDTDDIELQMHDIDALLSYHVAGVVIMDATASLQTAEMLKRFRIPAVLFNRVVPGSGLHSVSCENETAAREIARLLIDRGCKSFTYVGGREGASTHIERLKGFTEELENHGFGCQVLPGDFTYGTGYRNGAEMVESGRLTDAVFAVTDIMAYGIFDAFRDRGVRVPEQVKLIGFDDIEMSSWSPYQLSTYAHPVDRMVALSIELLLDPERSHADGEVHYLPGEMKLRGTT
ncbi:MULTISPECIES: LacI family DNA-binding transcriptional regulator [Bhargavaea]|uniref:LacI family DNA-binding transcriptional regulator n=1 Tax=Bhargavaea changchunensis TaxID=2134037 RepID=A0ABW2NG18_9BACL|nr:LacI family DNA-binding transcriptional regulator [Bhargavaea sp. CC-171006]